MAGVIVSGARPTGRQHLGNYHGALKNWVRLQSEATCFFFVADWHALTTDYASPGEIEESTIEMVLDWLAVGLDPRRATLFQQSAVKEHAELYLLLGMLTPVPWLERTPSYKEQRQQLTDRDLSTYGFLGYPLLQAADILLYKAAKVPVGIDQAPHIELTREIARRFNQTYRPLFPEPETLLTESPKIVGTDGRKMSKSYRNAVYLTDPPAEIETKLGRMVTDPRRARRTDPGEPNDCPARPTPRPAPPPPPPPLRHAGRAPLQGGGVPHRRHRRPRVQAHHGEARAGGAGADPRPAGQAQRRRRPRRPRSRERARPRGR